MRANLVRISSAIRSAGVGEAGEGDVNTTGRAVCRLVHFMNI